MTEKKAGEVLKNQLACEKENRCEGYCEECQYHKSEEDWITALNVAISALKKQEADGWIPVSKDLPEKDCSCRVTVKNEIGKYVGDCFWNKGKKQFENWNAYLDCYIEVSDVTAWKPIEEPYTEEET